jgi:hypothetical protein
MVRASGSKVNMSLVRQLTPASLFVGFLNKLFSKFTSAADRRRGHLNPSIVQAITTLANDLARKQVHGTPQTRRIVRPGILFNTHSTVKSSSALPPVFDAMEEGMLRTGPGGGFRAAVERTMGVQAEEERAAEDEADESYRGDADLGQAGVSEEAMGEGGADEGAMLSDKGALEEPSMDDLAMAAREEEHIVLERVSCGGEDVEMGVVEGKEAGTQAEGADEDLGLNILFSDSQPSQM